MSSISEMYMQSAAVFREWSKPNLIDMDTVNTNDPATSVVPPNIRTNGQGLAMLSGDFKWTSAGVADTAYDFLFGLKEMVPIGDQISVQYSGALPVIRSDATKTYGVLAGFVWGVVFLDKDYTLSRLRIIDSSSTMSPLQNNDEILITPITFPIKGS